MIKIDRFLPGLTAGLVLACLTVFAGTSRADGCGSNASQASSELRHASTDAMPVSSASASASMEQAKDGAQGKSQDIVAVAVGAGNFTTLVRAVQAAGLVETLQGKGPFTVFAPTDEAFAMLPKGTLEGLLKDKKKLVEVLTYHVVPGKVMAADVVKLKGAKTVQGQSITIDATDGVKVDGAKVVMTDVMASNGVIHVIDQVILPSAPKNGM